jgi:tetratricopeptide (TPR) repeat protein
MARAAVLSKAETGTGLTEEAGRPRPKLIWDASNPGAPVPSKVEAGAARYLVKFHRGCMCADAGRLRTAAGLFREAIRIKRDFTEAHYNLGVVLTQSGELPEAITAYREAVKINPSLWEAQHNLSIALSRNGQLAEAVETFRETIKLSAADAIVSMMAGKSAAQSVGNVVDAHLGLGRALANSGQLPEAIAVLREAVKIDPGSVQAYYQLAVAYTHSHQVPEAIAAFRNIVNVTPEDASAWSVLGGMLLENSQLPEAIAACREAVRIEPGLAQAHLDLGEALAKTGQMSEAIVAFGKAVETASDSEREEIVKSIVDEVARSASIGGAVSATKNNVYNEGDVDDSAEYSAAAADARTRGLSLAELKEAVEQKLAEKAKDAADKTTRRAKEPPCPESDLKGAASRPAIAADAVKGEVSGQRPEWKDYKGKMALPEFVAWTYAAEREAGTLTKATLRGDFALYTDYYNWRRKPNLPEDQHWLRDLPTGKRLREQHEAEAGVDPSRGARVEDFDPGAQEAIRAYNRLNRRAQRRVRAAPA